MGTCSLFSVITLLSLKHYRSQLLNKSNVNILGIVVLSLSSKKSSINSIVNPYLVAVLVKSEILWL